jgi:ubiquinol-cytochrome c reductase cytochrome b subunit
LPFYAILRAVPDKLGGVICMFAALLILFLLPFIDKDLYYSSRFSFTNILFFSIFSITMLILG